MPNLIFVRTNSFFSLTIGTDLVRIPHLSSNIPLKFGCCQGLCGTCAIKIIKGEENLSPMTKQERETLCRLQLEGYRLACQCALIGDVEIDA